MRYRGKKFLLAIGIVALVALTPPTQAEDGSGAVRHLLPFAPLT